MSVEAVRWAIKQPVTRSSSKFILVILANCVNADEGDSLAFASAAYLAEATAMDRKTVLTAIQRLEADGYIEDTGERRGRTKQVIVWRLTAPKTAAPVAESQTASPPVQEMPAAGQGTLLELPEEPARAARYARRSQKRDTSTKLATGGVPESTRIPEDWILPPEWRAWTRTERPNWSDEDITRISLNFHDNWRSEGSAKAFKPDWFAAWRIWIRKEHDPRPAQKLQFGSTAMSPEDYAAIGARIRAEAQQAGWVPFRQDIVDIVAKGEMTGLFSYPQAVPKSVPVPH